MYGKPGLGRSDRPSTKMSGMTRAPELFDLSGKVAVVTGSTKGIGRAMAEGLAECGADVVVSSRRQDACEEAAAEIAAATGRRAVGLACHMGDWDAVPGFVDAVYDAYGRVDVLVNNAGIHPGPMPIAELTLAYWEKLYDVNVRGPARLAGLVAPRMRDAGGGSIVNVATVGAYSGGANVGVYTSGKAALIALTKAMAREWAPWGIRVNAISPGPFLSEMMLGAERMSEGFLERSSAATMQKRVAALDEIKGAIVYFAGDASSYVTGEDHVVSGGMLRSG
jgi:NAD(P)-dependent dehydrogenase (short-subunit alcohol dehydrogenase family)